MKLSATTTLTLLAVAATGCTITDRAAEPRTDGSAARSASAVIRNAAGQPVAEASAIEQGDALRISLVTTRMTAGTYGAHIHAVGRCDAPDFASAGPHWNPTGQQHGKNNPAGMHKGDLPNLLVGTDGRGSLEINIPAAQVAGGSLPMLDADGAAIVIHQSADDYRTDPSGNSGGRIACGVFG